LRNLLVDDGRRREHEVLVSWELRRDNEDD
jgi:hypothetical protein